MTILKGLVIVAPDAEKGVWAEELVVAASGEIKEELEEADGYLCPLPDPDPIPASFGIHTSFSLPATE